ncbi:hypothetical protein [Streptomyces sp. AS58]|uniref:hypothetical protein n=1 Tax=Streptomyces sp. AS58 TaxID=1519489 RepID=UPI00131C0CA1|nr:hypothetical protein [Streptomyces sp. AS58]
MAADSAEGWAQRWSRGVPTWVHTSQGGFDRRRYEVVELAEAPAREYIQANHYLSGSGFICICQVQLLVTGPWLVQAYQARSSPPDAGGSA